MKRPDEKLLIHADNARRWRMSHMSRNLEGRELFNWLVDVELISTENGVMNGNVTRAEILESLAYDGVEVKS